MELFLTPGRVAEAVKNGDSKGWKMYITDESCSRWVEFGGRGRLKPPNGLTPQRSGGRDTLAEVWEFVSEVFRANPGLTGRLDDFHRLYSIRQIPFTGRFYPELRKDQQEAVPLPEVSLFVADRDLSTSIVVARPGQQEFRKAVIDRYGARCAFCRVCQPALLDAAHVVPWNRMGSDNPSNGLVLCKLHHAAFDGGFIVVDPSTLQLHYFGHGLDAAALHVEHSTIAHLPNQPWTLALQDLWDRKP